MSQFIKRRGLWQPHRPPGVVIQDEGSILGRFRTLDFVGAGVVATDEGSHAKLTINPAVPSSDGGIVHFDYVVDPNYTGAEGDTITLSTGSTVIVYTTIMGAVNAADAANTAQSILINAGIYNENVIIPDTLIHPLYIRGQGRDRTIIRPSSGVAFDYRGSPGPTADLFCIFSDMQFDGTTYGLTYTDAGANNAIFTRCVIDGTTAAIKDQAGVDDQFFFDCDLVGDIDFGTVNTTDFHFDSCRITGDIIKTSSSGSLTRMSWNGGWINGFVDMDSTADITFDTNWVRTINTFHVKIRTSGDATGWIIRGRMAALSGASSAKQYIYILDGTTPQVRGIKIDVQCYVPSNTTNQVNYLYADTSFSNGEVQSVEAFIEQIVNISGQSLTDMANSHDAVYGVFNDSVFCITPHDDTVNITTGANNLVLSGDSSPSAVGTVDDHNHLGVPTELTISSGLVTRTQDAHTIDTESDASSDNLAGVQSGTDGDLLLIRPVHDDRTVVVLHQDTGEAAIGERFWTADGNSITLDDQLDYVLFKYETNVWVEVFRRGNVPQKISKSIMFHSPNEDLAVEDWLSDQAVRVPASGKHGTWTPGTIYVRVGTAGTGTNTILFRTSTTLAGTRTTRATVSLGTAREASASITWTPADGEYLWVAVSAVGATAPKNGVAQIDIEETLYS